jgi:hypothetical protein
VNVRSNRYHHLASSLNFFPRSSLPGPEEASPFHTITVSGFLTVGSPLMPDTRSVVAGAESPAILMAGDRTHCESLKAF